MSIICLLLLGAWFFGCSGEAGPVYIRTRSACLFYTAMNTSGIAGGVSQAKIITSNDLDNMVTDKIQNVFKDSTEKLLGDMERIISDSLSGQVSELKHTYNSRWGRSLINSVRRGMKNNSSTIRSFL